MLQQMSRVWCLSKEEEREFRISQPVIFSLPLFTSKCCETYILEKKRNAASGFEILEIINILACVFY